MTKHLTILIILALFTSCKNVPANELLETDTIENAASETSEDDLRNNSLTNQNGEELYLVYNLKQNTAIVKDRGIEIELINQKPMKGVWYKNDSYDLRGVENDLIFRREGNIIFSNKVDSEYDILTDDDGNTLEIQQNKSTNEATIYLKGLESITLKSQSPSSGIWYKDEHYELKGKNHNIELKKDGVLLFKQKDVSRKTLYKDASGNTLELSFKKSTDVAIISYNGGRPITLLQQFPASGMWYKKGRYEFRGKGESFDFSIDGQLVFSN
jgi:membrane-bound inhibitor of C-type lysozyme